MRILVAACSGTFAWSIAAWDAQWASVPFTLAIVAYVLGRSY